MEWVGGGARQHRKQKAFLVVSNIWLLCVILLGLNPVQYRKAVCRMLSFWFIMKN